MEYNIANKINIIKPQDVAERVTEVLKRTGKTQADCAHILGISQPAISKYLSGRIPPAETLFLLAQLGNTTMEWILTGEKNYFYAVPQEKQLFNDTEQAYGGKDSDLQLTDMILALPDKAKKLVREMVTLFVSYNEEAR